MARLLLLWIAAFYAAPLYANASIKSVDTLGEYIFGPQVSQAEACKRAEARAREQAIRRTFGEVYFSEQSLGCSEKTNSECEYARVSVSHLNGYILDFKDRKERVSDQGGLRVCRVSGLAVLDTSKRSDPALFFDITLNRHVYGHGDELKPVGLDAGGLQFPRLSHVEHHGLCSLLGVGVLDPVLDLGGADGHHVRWSSEGEARRLGEVLQAGGHGVPRLAGAQGVGAAGDDGRAHHGGLAHDGEQSATFGQ